MRNKTSYPKTPFPLLSPLPRLNIIPNFSPSSWQQCRSTGNGGWGQSIMCWTDLTCSFLFSGRTWGPSPRGQSCMNCSQCESFPWAAVLQELPQHVSLSMGSCLQEQAALLWPPQGHSPLWASPCSSVVSSMGCRDTASSLWAAPQAEGQPQLWCLEHLLPLLPLGSVETFFWHGFPPFSGWSCAVFFFAFLTLLPLRCHYHGWQPIANPKQEDTLLLALVHDFDFNNFNLLPEKWHRSCSMRLWGCKPILVPFWMTILHYMYNTSFVKLFCSHV